MTLLEVCVETATAAVDAAARGADRIELCSRLDLDGLTPERAEQEAAVARCPVPVHAMIRPRGGDFVHGDDELDGMEREIASAREVGVAGLVFGVLTSSGAIDRPALERLMAASEGVPVTFHRAFDRVPEHGDARSALDTLMELGVRRVLTSGGAPTAWEGREALREWIEHTSGELIVLPGGGIRQPHVHELIAFTGATEVHSSVVLELG